MSPGETADICSTQPRDGHSPRQHRIFAHRMTHVCYFICFLYSTVSVHFRMWCFIMINQWRQSRCAMRMVNIRCNIGSLYGGVCLGMRFGSTRELKLAGPSQAVEVYITVLQTVFPHQVPGFDNRCSEWFQYYLAVGRFSRC